MYFTTTLSNYIQANSKSKDNVTKRFLSVLETDDISFSEQRSFIKSEALNIVACCSRRAGKTSGIVLKIILHALTKPKSNIIYITDTRKHAKGLIWEPLIEMCERVSIPIDIRISDLEIRFKDTGSKVWLMGAETESEIKKVLGYAFDCVFIDEAQHFPEFLEVFCVERLMPALTDRQGTLVLTGTPNDFCSGYFYDCFSAKSGWQQHFWTWRNNHFLVNSILKKTPELGDVDGIMTSILARSNKKDTDPGIRRDWYGEWVRSMDLFVYQYDVVLNTYKTLPKSDDWSYVIGVDQGGRTGYDAVVVVGYPKYSGILYVIEEHKFHGKSTSKLVDFVKEMQDKYRPIQTILDEGGLGSKTNEEYQDRYGVHMEAAIKPEKFAYIGMLNSDLSTGNILMPDGSITGSEMLLHRWDKDSLAKRIYKEEKTANHLCDALLYAWRWCYHHLKDKREQIPKYGTQERFDYDKKKFIDEKLFGKRTKWS